MERNRLIALVLIVIVVSGVFAVFVVVPAFQTHFHYEKAYPPSETKHVWVAIEDFSEPMVVGVSFVDDPLLMYRIDVIQQAAGLQHRFSYEESSFDPTMILVSVTGAGDERVESIDIVLGTGTSYDMTFVGGHMNATVSYDNSAVISPRDGDTIERYDISADCDTLTFIMTENVQFDSSGLLISIPSHTNLHIEVDLPDGMNCLMDVAGGSDISVAAYGLSVLGGPDSHTIFRTSSIDEPLLEIDVGSWGVITGYLQV
ncbi:MAG: hypothetical protein ACTSSE_19045 [Candidatus Thorarchaeota archaeon]